MTEADREKRLRAYPDLLAGLVRAVELVGRLRDSLWRLREHCEPKQWED